MDNKIEVLDFVLGGWSSPIYVRAETDCGAFDLAFDVLKSTITSWGFEQGHEAYEEFCGSLIGCLFKECFATKVAAEYERFRTSSKPIVFINFYYKKVSFAKYEYLQEIDGRSNVFGFETTFKKVKRNRPEYLLKAWQKARGNKSGLSKSRD